MQLCCSLAHRVRACVQIDEDMLRLEHLGRLASHGDLQLPSARPQRRVELELHGCDDLTGAWIVRAAVQMEARAVRGLSRGECGRPPCQFRGYVEGVAMVRRLQMQQPLEDQPKRQVLKRSGAVPRDDRILVDCCAEKRQHVLRAVAHVHLRRKYDVRSLCASVPYTSMIT